ncbi:GWxTD domain-containing protein, partial [Candidatus Aminicenantes bacterium AC-708-M15]|nr:GWxTD domain-containing protein [Candidatus Aminicenantes bacterium AC-708-M15]
FLELPPEERKKFIEEFWKRRDPDPTTEVNEFKEEYYKRIEEANKLFRGEGREGWLTDRGRIYVIFGPPTSRFTYPMGHPEIGRPAEIWYYGWFPVVFVDWFWNGTYTLETHNVVYLHELNKAQAIQQARFRPEKPFFDLNWRLKKLKRKDGEVSGLLILEIPYKTIWFKSKDKNLETTLELFFEIVDENKNKLTEYKNDYYLAMTEDELKLLINDKYSIKVDFTFEDVIQTGEKKKYILHLKLINLTGEEEIKKDIKFTI